jgi:hypothetical protein
MSVPGSNQVQFVPAGPGNFTVDRVSDPGGPPSSVLDVDLGFEVTRTVQLPNWLNGKGKVCIYADELGGQIDQRLDPCTEFDVVADPNEPAQRHTRGLSRSRRIHWCFPILQPARSFTALPPCSRSATRRPTLRPLLTWGCI